MSQAGTLRQTALGALDSILHRGVDLLLYGTFFCPTGGHVCIPGIKGIAIICAHARKFNLARHNRRVRTRDPKNQAITNALSLLPSKSRK